MTTRSSAGRRPRRTGTATRRRFLLPTILAATCLSLIGLGVGHAIDNTIIPGGAQWEAVENTGLYGGLTGVGAGWADFDDDGDLDVYNPRQSGFPSSRMLLQEDVEFSFDEATDGTIMPHGYGTSVVDFDDDGLSDIFLARVTGSGRIFRNTGQLLPTGAPDFEDVTPSSLANPGGDVGLIRNGAWGDFDSDGDLDLYVPSHKQNLFFENDGAGGFEDISDRYPPMASMPDEGSECATWVDYDDDGDLDLFIGNTRTQDNQNPVNRLIRQDRDGGTISFTGVTGSSGEIGVETNTLCAAWADYDNDGDLDLFIGKGTSDLDSQLFRNDPGSPNNRNFVDVTMSKGLSGIDQIVNAAVWEDFDNDGDLDLYLAREHAPGLLYHNSGFPSHSFVDVTSQIPLPSQETRAVAVFDYNDDGAADMHWVRFQEPYFVQNNSAESNHWLHVDLVGTDSSAEGIGARVMVFAENVVYTREIGGGGGQTGMGPIEARFGLGDATEVGVEIRWPSGIVQQIPRVQADQRLTVVETDPQWTEIVEGDLNNPEISRGVAWGDFDNDGDPDLYLVKEGPNRLLVNNNGLFLEYTPGGLGDAGFGISAVWGDYDNDGYLDLYLVSRDANEFGESRLFRNTAMKGWGFVSGFEDVTTDLLRNHFLEIESAAWVDYDNDSRLDLYLCNGKRLPDKMLRFNGSEFSDVTDGVGLSTTEDGSVSAAFADYDNDGDQDVYLVRQQTRANKLLAFDSDTGMFVDVTPVVMADSEEGRSAVWGDYDNDGDLDMYLTNAFSGANRLYENSGSPNYTFTDVTSGALALPGETHAAGWGDYDNDGDLDLYITNWGSGTDPGAEAPNRLLRNDDGTFVDATEWPLDDPGQAQGMSWVDYNGDGRLDIYIANRDGHDRLFRNDVINGNHWVEVKLMGMQANSTGLGARVRVSAGGRQFHRQMMPFAGYRSQEPFILHVGVGDATLIDLIEVYWPTTPWYGQGWTDLAVDQLHWINEWIMKGRLVEADETPTTAPKLAFQLDQNVPNPFNPATEIKFSLPRAGAVSLRIYDVSGRVVRTLVNDELEAGQHDLVWNGKDDAGGAVASGVYHYKLTSSEGTISKRMTLVR